MHHRKLFLVVTFALCLPGMLMAQSGTGTIDGVVTDPSGAVVPGAEVTITNKSTGTEKLAITTDSGVYRAPFLSPGTYMVSAALTGFKTAVADNVALRLAQVLTVNLVLEVGEVTEVVTVSSEGPLLETSTAEIGTNVTAKEIAAWPILVSDGTRQLQDFIFRAMPGTQGGGFAGSINGGQSYSHEILIDGITIGRMDLNGGSNSEFTPTMDAVSEFKLQTGALSSQYGATQTALTNFGMKSGDNEFHGTAFLFYQDKSLNANSWNNNRRGNEKSPFSQKNFGASGGGPIIKDKTHFYVSYEGDRFEDLTPAGNQEDIPVAAFKQGDFSDLFNPAFTLDDSSGTVVGQDALGRDVIVGQIYDPSTERMLSDGTWIRDPYPGNQIPTSTFSSVTQAMLAGHDLPDAQDNLLRYNNDSVGTCCPERTINNLSVKIDHVINDAHKVAGTLVYNDRARNRFGTSSTPYLPLEFPGPALAGFKNQATPGHIFRFSEDWTINPTILNHFALGYNRFQNANVAWSWLQSEAGEVDWKSELGLKNDQPGETFPQIYFSAHQEILGSFYGQFGHAGNGGSPNGSTVASDDLSWLKGNHNLRFGAELRWYYNNSAARQQNGNYRFHSENTALPGFINETGFSYASFLLGNAYNTSMGIQGYNQGLRTKLFAMYVQDDWKVSPNFTLNLGLRWDVPTPLYDKNGGMSSLLLSAPNTGADGYPGTLGFLSGPGDRWADTYYKQFAPRIGFAWSPNATVVLRGGYGINYSPSIRDGWYTTYGVGFNGSNPQVERRGEFREQAIFNWDDTYPAYTGTLPNKDPNQLNGQSISWYNPDTNKQPRVQNWNIGVQFDAGWDTRLEINYVGNHGDFLNEPRYLSAQNQVPTQNLALGDTLIEDISLHPEYLPYPSFTGTVGEALKPFPQYRNVSSHRRNGSWSNYNSLQVQATKRSSFGLSFLTSYTWSKTLGTSDTSGPGAYSYYAQDFYNRRADYGVSSYHYPHDLKLTFVYDLPMGPQGSVFTDGAAAYIMGGWQLSGILRYRSGDPLGISTGGYVDDALFNPGIRPDVVGGDQTVSSVGELDPDNGTQYLNPSAFGTPPKTDNNVPLRFGTAPRWLPNTRTFTLLGEDISLIKRTDLGFREGANFEIRFDMINFFNRTRWSGPNTNVTSANFGKVFSKGGGPRRIQLGIRFTF